MQALTNQRKDRFMATPSLTAERLRELLHYDPKTGAFTWKVRRGGSANATSASGTLVLGGYRSIRVDGYRHMAHRLAWLYMTGGWPSHHIDHVNGVRDDNRLNNLRDATPEKNAQNRQRAQSNNDQGLLGVSTYNNPRRPFAARIRVAGKLYRLGSFRTAEEAHEAYLVAKRDLHAGCTI